MVSDAETHENRSYLNGIKSALDKLSKSIKEGPNSPWGLSMAKELSMVMGISVGHHVTAFAPAGGMQKLTNLWGAAKSPSRSPRKDNSAPPTPATSSK